MSCYLRGSRRRTVGLPVIGVILTSLVLGCRAKHAPEEATDIRSALSERTPGTQTAGPPPIRAAVARFYDLRGMRFAWTARKPLSVVDDALALIAAADEHGFDRALYGYDGL